MKKTFAFFAALIPSFLCAHPHSLSLQEAQRSALEGNEEYLALKEQVEAGRYRRLQSFSSWMPQASLEHTFLKTQKPLIGEDQEFHTTNFSISQPLFVSDLYYGVKSSRSSLDVLESRLSTARQDLSLEVLKAYYLVILSREEVLVQKENIEVLLSALQREKSELEYGESTAFEVSQSKVSVSNAFLSYYEAEKSLKVAKDALVRLLGMTSEQGKNLTLQEENIPVLSIPEVQKKLKELEKSLRTKEGDFITEHLIARLQGKVSEEGAEVYTLHEVSIWEEKAVANRSEVRLKRAEYKLATEHLRQSQAKYLPQVNAFADLSKRSPLSGTASTQYDNWHMGIRLQWSLFDGLGRERKIQEAHLLERAASLFYQGAVEAVKVQVRSSIYELQEALLSYSSAQESVALADEALLLAKERLKVGMITPLEYRDAAASHTQAKQNLNRASYDLLTSYYSLQHAAGLGF